MASAPAVTSLWDQLVPDLQRRIHGLAVEQHCRELMRTQICPSIILAGLKRNQAQYEELTEKDEIMGPADVNLLKALQSNCAFEEAFQALHRSLADLTRAERCLWMGRLKEVVPAHRLTAVFVSKQIMHEVAQALILGIWD
jgi:hypothetical protein